jgi:hypothetical protein
MCLWRVSRHVATFTEENLFLSKSAICIQKFEVSPSRMFRDMPLQWRSVVKIVGAGVESSPESTTAKRNYALWLDLTKHGNVRLCCQKNAPFSPNRPDTLWGPASYLNGAGAPSSGVKRPGRAVNRSPLSSAEVKNEWNDTSTPIPVMACRVAL